MEFAHKNIRLRPESYRGTRLIFITLCCEAKKSVFADGERAWWLIDCVRKEAQASRFAVHAFCVMPDHFHALVQGLDRSSDLLLGYKIGPTLKSEGWGTRLLWLAPAVKYHVESYRVLTLFFVVVEVARNFQ